MTQFRHGISIGIERINSDIFLSLKAIGKLTHQDYQSTIPVIEAALSGIQDPKINLFIDGSEFDGWDLRAAWDDLKLGLKHNREFSKVAIYGNKKWQERIAKVGSWFISGEVKFFEDSNEALEWLL